MRKLAIIALCTFSTPALAGVGSLLDNAGVASLTGTVEVPLLADPDGSLRPMVAVTFNDSEKISLMAINGRSGVIRISEGLAKELELKVKTKKDKVAGELKYVDIDALTIGGLVLNDVRAVVSGSSRLAAEDMEIGMGALPGIAWGVSPSAGTVSFVRASEGATLLSAVGGTPVAYTSVPWGSEKFGTDKVLQAYQNLVVEASVGGQTVQAALDPSDTRGSISSAVALPDSTPSTSRGDVYSYWLDLSVAGNASQDWFEKTSAYVRGGYQHQAVIGADYLAGYDLAVDPGTQQLVLAPAKAQKRQDASAMLIEQAEKDLEKALTEAAEAKAEAPAPEEGEESKGDPAQAGAYAALAATYDRFHKTDKAVASWAKVVEHDDSSCTNWLSYGKAQQEAGDVDGAIVALGKASELYHSWWDHPLETRLEMSRAADKGTGPVLDESGTEDDPKSQPGACYVADGHLAMATLAKGELDGVEAIYRKNLDLDAGLALAWGNAALVGGELTKAYEPLRQAIKLEASPDASHRLALAVAYAGNGDRDTAGDLFDASLGIQGEDPVALALWLNNIKEQEGADKAFEAATAWVTNHPQSPAAHLANVLAAADTGDESAVASAKADADKVFATALERRPGDATLQAIFARYSVLTGDLEAASTAADKAVELNPGLGLAWLAKADVEAAKGHGDEAKRLLKTAGTVSTGHPGYALLLGEL